MSLIQRVLTNLEERRERVVNGGINCIPSPFKSFRGDFPGVEKGVYYLVSGATKAAKTQIATYLFIYAPLLFAYNNPDKLRLKIFYFPLEETQEKIVTRFMSYLLYTKRRIRIAPANLRSTNEENIVDKSILEELNTLEIRSMLDFFEDHVLFISERNPTGVWKTIKKYAEEAGTIHRKVITIENKETNIKQEKEVFDYYEPKDPDEYVIIFIDHAGRLEQERGLSKKENIDKLSEYLMAFRDKYGYSPVLIQQQNSDTVSLEAFKANKIRPTYNGLMDTKQTGQDIQYYLYYISVLLYFDSKRK